MDEARFGMVKSLGVSDFRSVAIRSRADSGTDTAAVGIQGFWVGEETLDGGVEMENGGYS